MLLSLTIFTLCLSAVALPVIENPAEGLTIKCTCAGTNGTDGAQFHCGDRRLGPAKLPHKFPFDAMLATYSRFGDLCPDAWLAKYTHPSTGALVFPPDDGFQISDTARAIKGSQTLVPGMLLDRFGFEGGRFLAPAFTPYGQRALTPSSLADPPGGPQANYRVYRVTQEFIVLTGTIAAWFEQPGQGTQYLAARNVSSLIADGFLESVDFAKLRKFE